MMDNSWLIFTDLDGTLLDHYSYQADAALVAVRALQARQVPIVFNTSKTLEECESLATRLAIAAPFIVENGSAIYLPKYRHSRPVALEVTPEKDSKHSHKSLIKNTGRYWCVQLGASHTEIQSALADLVSHFKFKSISQSSLQEICELTGLSMPQATRARKRQFSEPLVWQDSQAALDRFRLALSARGFTLLKGGRFYHVLGQTDKGVALNYFKRMYEREHRGQSVTTVALGDSYNDIDMLKSADIPIWIRSPAHDVPETEKTTSARVSQLTGPAGWHESIFALIAEQSANHPNVTSTEK